MNYPEKGTDSKVKFPLFIYIINPPTFDFVYSSGVYNGAGNTLIKTIRNIKQSRIWDTFSVDQSEKSSKGQSFACTLDIYQDNKLIRADFKKYKDWLFPGNYLKSLLQTIILAA